METATITNTFTGGQFSISMNGISLSGYYRKSDSTGRLTEFRFEGTVEDTAGDGQNFSGSFDGSNINYYAIPVGRARAVAEAVESVYAQLSA